MRQAYDYWQDQPGSCARALRRGTATPLQLGKGSREPPTRFVHDWGKLPVSRGPELCSPKPLHHVFQFSLRTLNVPTRACTRWGKIPVAHALLIRSTLGGRSSLPLRLNNSRYHLGFCLAWPQGPALLSLLSTGSACVPVRGLVPVLAGGSIDKARLLSLSSRFRLLPHICFSISNFPSCTT